MPPPAPVPITTTSYICSAIKTSAAVNAYVQDHRDAGIREMLNRIANLDNSTLPGRFGWCNSRAPYIGESVKKISVPELQSATAVHDKRASATGISVVPKQSLKS